MIYETTQGQNQMDIHIHSDSLTKRDVFALVILQEHLRRAKYLTPSDLASKVGTELDKVMAAVNK